MNPAHPIYIVSKGRWVPNRRLTSRALHAMAVPHFLVVEEQEAKHYRWHADDSATVLVLDPAYKRDYETWDDLGPDKSTGPGPARNFAWDHAVANGAPWHWVMDDNIQRFYRLNRNAKLAVADGTILRVMEAFCERYENVSMAGPNYESMILRREAHPPLYLNTRIYSCNLIRNDVPYRWRGRYNEDTDLSLRMLKDGWVTVEFNAFLQNKVATQRVRGGNTAEFYAGEGTLPKSTMLERLHPDVATVTWRFNRWHHWVNYEPFKRNRLRLRPGVVIPSGNDEFGMFLERRTPTGAWVRDMSRVA